MQLKIELRICMNSYNNLSTLKVIIKISGTYTIYHNYKNTPIPDWNKCILFKYKFVVNFQNCFST